MLNQLETPYYCINQDSLQKDINLLRSSLATNWGKSNYIMGYSVKTNSLPWLLTFLKKEGFYGEIVSETEYQLVKRLGFQEQEIIYNGPIKGQNTFETLLLQGGILNMDSQEELVFLEILSQKYPDKSFSIGVRVNFDVEANCPGETLMGKTGGRFGYCYENGELEKVIKKINKLPNVTLAGLHMHSSSQSRTLHIYQALAHAACVIKTKYNLPISYVDMGGGYFGGCADKPTYADYFRVICEELKKAFDPTTTTLIVEPGVSLISTCSTFVTTVKDVKDIRGQRYLVTDGSRLHLNPQVTRHVYPHHYDLVSWEKERTMLPSQWICGFTCMEYDKLFEMKEEHELTVGDKVIYDTAGGYTMCLNPLFIRYFPAVYIEKKDGSYFTAREEWTIDEYLQKNFVE